MRSFEEYGAMLAGWSARRAFNHCRFTRWNRPKAAAMLSIDRSGPHRPL